MPWRKDINFNNITPEELSLRGYQTQVKTVIPYYEKWMSKWPTISDLAEATLEQVHETWSGLGYYSRATRILEAAKFIVSEMNGNLPMTVQGLLKIPGIGPYTAAISSIAFNQVEPLVDGNVVRVLSRIESIYSDPKSKSSIKLFWELATCLVDKQNPGNFNQSLMELGATLCSVRNPSCSDCPIAFQCNSYSRIKNPDSNCEYCVKFNDIEELNVIDFPMKVKLKTQKTQECLLSIIEFKSSFLLKKNSEKGLLASLWDFPHSLYDESNKENKSLHDSFINDIISQSTISQRKELGEYVHVFSHIKRTSHVEWILLDSNEFELPDDMKWVQEDELMSEAAVPTTFKKSVALLKNKTNKRQPTLDSFFTKKKNKK